MNNHVLENNEQARENFERRAKSKCGVGAAGYREAVIDCTGGLPTWAAPRKPGPRPGRKPSKRVPVGIEGMTPQELLDFSRKLSIVIAAATRS